MPIISFNPSTNTVTKRGNVVFTSDNASPKDLVISSIVQMESETGNIVVSAQGKFWRGDMDMTKMTQQQTVTVSEIGPNTMSYNDYDTLIGKSLASLITTAQSDWLVGDTAYKVRTAVNSTTLSIVMELKINGAGQYTTSTGRYWMVNQPTWSNNEIEKVWVENNSLYVNVNRSNVNGSSNIIAKLADL